MPVGGVRSERNRRILALALPIIGGMMSQNILNLIDTAMVGVLGDTALAAIGMANFVAFLCQAFIMGISTGVQAMAARRIGEGSETSAVSVLNSAIMGVVAVIPLLTLVLLAVLPRLYPLLNDDPQVVQQSLPYLRYRILGTLFIGLNFSFRGFWNAVDRSRVYMTTLVTMNVTNALLNYVFIFGKFGFPELGVGGAGLATLCATGLGAVLYTLSGVRVYGKKGFLRSLMPWTQWVSLIKVSIPSSIQQILFAAGFVVTFWIIGTIGTPELAAANVLLNVMMIALFPGMGFGVAASTLVGQALGRKDTNDALRWGYDVLKVASVVLFGFGLVMALFPDVILGVFIHNRETLSLARFPLRLTGMVMPLETVGSVFMFSLLGAGATGRVMVVSVGAQWLLFLPAAYLLGPVAGLGLGAVWAAQCVYRVITGMIFWVLWRRKRWAAIAV